MSLLRAPLERLAIQPHLETLSLLKPGGITHGGCTDVTIPAARFMSPKCDLVCCHSFCACLVCLPLRPLPFLPCCCLSFRGYDELNVHSITPKQATCSITPALVCPDTIAVGGCRTPDPGDDLDNPGMGLKRQSRVPEPGRTNCFSMQHTLS